MKKSDSMSVHIHKYPDPDRVEINESDLRLKLREYADAVRLQIAPSDFLLITSAWIPVLLRSEFTDFAGFAGPEIKGAYIMAVALGTVGWLFYGRNSFRILFLKFPLPNHLHLFFTRISLEQFKAWQKNVLDKYETDPDKKVVSLSDRCNCKDSTQSR